MKNIFIKQQLQEESVAIDGAQTSLMQSRGFSTSNFYSDRGFKVTDTTLQYDHLAKHRFVDMRTRESKAGKKRKKNHPIHNRILYGHANNIVKRLHFGYTEAVKEQMQELYNTISQSGS
ncbi:hypothetical protein ACFFVB_18520 [Formosa undariae]|uniref:Uncharacterized protein n=1 Tax=Formosa undariae TaxID=1325436 RepID=A0ABV5F6K5_9FLAO